MALFGQRIHESCPYRDAPEVHSFGQLNACLEELGCKGPQTHANCSTSHFGEVPGAWPIGLGHPCVGCTEQKLAFRVPIHDTVPIDRPTPPDTYPDTVPSGGGATAVAAGAAGLILGAAAGAGVMASKKLGEKDATESGED